MSILTDKKKDNNKVVGALRRTQIITTFGPGAIADMPEYSVIMASTDYWSRYCRQIKEPNLQHLLNVEFFKEPYVSESKDSGPSPDTKAFRFPYMHFCPECGKLMNYRKFHGLKGGQECPECHKKLIPSRFLAVCCNGHIEDFPYRWWVHGGDYSECDDKHGEHLRIRFSDTSGGLDSIVVTCEKCHKSRTMAGCMGKDALRGYNCNGHRPWLGIDPRKTDDETECTAPMRTIQRGASNAYFGLTESALTIPPWSSSIYEIILKNEDSIRALVSSNAADNVWDYYINDVFKDIIKQNAATVEQIKNIIMNDYSTLNQTEYTRQSIREDEYRMFCAGDKDDPNFTTEQVPVSQFLGDYVSNIVLVKRVREVLALKGFRRLSPEDPEKGNDKFLGYNFNQGDYISLSRHKQNWLPAIELRGEGIFIKLDMMKLNIWEEKMSEYYKAMGNRLANSNVGCDNFSARYVLLHTLSHLLIKQLTLDCGYSGSAIKERIYSTYPDSSLDMCGILLYTSSSDSDGSLGGLVRQGLPEAMEKIFRNMLQESSWCSSDPICIESHAQGYDSLNYAACHACALISETSCEMRNCLLDRASVVGTPEDRTVGYFGDLLESM